MDAKEISKLKEELKHRPPKNKHEIEVVGHEYLLLEALRLGELQTKVELRLRKPTGWWRNAATSAERVALLVEVFRKLAPIKGEIEKALGILEEEARKTSQHDAQREKEALRIQARHNRPFNRFLRYFPSFEHPSSRSEIEKLCSSLSQSELIALRDEVIASRTLASNVRAGGVAYLNSKIMQGSGFDKDNPASLLRKVSQLMRGH